MGLRLVENIDSFPPPTPEEQQFLQLSFQIMGITQVAHIEQSKTLFKRWMLTNGFEDIHSCLRVTLERLFVLKTVGSELRQHPDLPVRERELELGRTASELHFPPLLNRTNALFPEPLSCTEYMISLNSARNSLVHTRGVVTERHCNTAEKDKLVVKGRRFRLFFKRDDVEVPAAIGKPGLENAALMLGAEDFAIEFAVGQTIELSLKQFLDILNTCVFIRADIDVKFDDPR
jgi:hypothetical protein